MRFFMFVILCTRWTRGTVNCLLPQRISPIPIPGKQKHTSNLNFFDFILISPTDFYGAYSRLQSSSSKRDSTKRDFCAFLRNLDFPIRETFTIFSKIYIFFNEKKLSKKVNSSILCQRVYSLLHLVSWRRCNFSLL